MNKKNIEELPVQESAGKWQLYLQWLYKAYEEFKKAKHIYKRSYYFYNKIYWDRRFREEIERVEKMAEVEKILQNA